MKIALDAMGGDYAPQNIVAGAVAALRVDAADHEAVSSPAMRRLWRPS